MTDIIEIGSRISDDHIIVSLLGAGGMGTVYRATDAKHDRTVAVKFCVTAHDRKDRSALLQREFETLQRLDHPAIPKVFDCGVTDDGKSFFTMELVEGETLGSVIKRAALPPIDVRVGWLREIAQALSHVHARGFLYCDLKPENIIIFDSTGGQSSIKLLDFGRKSGTGPNYAVGLRRRPRLVGRERAGPKRWDSSELCLWSRKRDRLRKRDRSGYL